MTPYQQRRCPLTQRLAEDMQIRNLAQATIDAYTYHARRFADFIQKPLDQATVEDVRNFQLHLIETRKLAYSSFNQAVCALRFLYTHEMKRMLKRIVSMLTRLIARADVVSETTVEYNAAVDRKGCDQVILRHYDAHSIESWSLPFLLLRW
jgi:FixJ family two-component response regulator